jgi:uncharacterized membrane protein
MATQEKETVRLEAFSDGIFAVAITLLIIELRPPVLEHVSNKTLFEGLLEKWPEYLAVVNSFASILLMWIAHHQLFKQINKPNTALVLVNGLLLLGVMLTVFATRVLGAYLLTEAASTAAMFYGGSCLVLSFIFVALSQVAIRQHGTLVPGKGSDILRKHAKGAWIGLLIYATATALAFVSHWITVGICTGIWMYWAANSFYFERLDRG